MPGMAMPSNKASKAPKEPYLTQSAPAAKDTEGTLVVTRADYVGKKVVYDLYVDDRLVNYTGKTRHAIGINGQIPAPTDRKSVV